MNRPLPVSCVEIPLREEIMDDTVGKAKDWSLMHGGALRSRLSGDSLDLAPVTLLPSVLSKAAFDVAIKAQTLLNTLIHRVAYDYDFLKETLQGAIEVDDFTRRLFDIYETVREAGPKQQVTLGLLRADYMEESGNFKQVEVNTISISLVGLSSAITDLHRYILREIGEDEKLKHLPENNALEDFSSGIVEAWTRFGNESAVILFVVEDVTYNICDQRMMEFCIRELEPKARVMRRTLTQLVTTASLDQDGNFVLDGKDIVGIVYYRTGYDPLQYKNESEWTIRLNIELSTAIKCPSIQYHLAGTKKVQQVLSQKGVVEKFLGDTDDSKIVRSMFTDQYPLDSTAEGEEGLRLAMEEPENFVLKPQREGGGNNVYGEDIRAAVERLGSDRQGWILMRRLNPRPTTNYILRPTQSPTMVNVVSELGIFGLIIGDESNIYVNKQCGHTLRTKLASVNEGGVSAGHGAIDSPFLI